MSSNFEDAEMCKGDKCTNLLTSRTEAKRGLCDACLDEKLEKSEAIYNLLKAGLDMILKREGR